MLCQSEWFPLTYGHANYDPFPAAPSNIPKEGYRDAFHLQTKWKGKFQQKKLNALAFRSGTGTSVALSFSTMSSELHWDLVPKKDKDLKWYLDTSLTDHQRFMKGFDVLVGETTNQIESSLLALVMPRSCGAAGQGSKEWFLDRMFSGTSSQIHSLLEAAAPLLLSSQDTDDEIKNALLDVAAYANQESVLSSPEPEPEPPEPDPVPEEEEEEEKNNDEEQQKSEAQETAEHWIETLTNASIQNSDDEFLRELPSIDNTTLSWMVFLLSKPDAAFKVTTKTSNLNKLRTWIKSPTEHRHLAMLSKNVLLEIAKEKKKKISGQNNKAKIIEKILEGNNNRSQQQNNNSNGNNTNNTNNSPDLAPLVAIFRQSFLRPHHQKSERTAAKIGQRNEEKFLSEFCELYNNRELNSPDFLLPLPLKVAYRPGLVAKRGWDNSFVKDSADGVLVFEKSNVSHALFFLFVLHCLRTYLCFVLDYRENTT